MKQLCDNKSLAIAPNNYTFQKLFCCYSFTCRFSFLTNELSVNREVTHMET